MILRLDWRKHRTCISFWQGRTDGLWIEYIHNGHLHNILEWLKDGFFSVRIVDQRWLYWLYSGESQKKSKHAKNVRTLARTQLLISKWYFTWETIWIPHCANRSYWQHLHAWNNRTISQNTARFMFRPSYLHGCALNSMSCLWILPQKGILHWFERRDHYMAVWVERSHEIGCMWNVE